MVGQCLEAGGPHAESRRVNALLDCARICETSTPFAAQGSHLHAEAFGVCATACERCADECERFPHDTMMAPCVEICYHAAKACRTMAAMAS